MSYNYDRVVWAVKKGDLISLRQMSYENELEYESYGIIVTDKIEREDDGQVGMFPYVWAYMFDTQLKRKIEVTHNIEIISNS
mgnify:CR=1 FL=1|tara:strand:- start:881 stop:1126 length:246 start_codon:yes stop_codon:yes gene_type:complete